MLRNITLGQYYPAGSPVHGLDARVKLLFVTVYVAVLFTLNGFWGYAAAAACLSLAVYASKVPPGFMFRGMKGILILIIFTTMLQIFFNQGETILFSFWRIKISLESLLLALRMTARLTLLICGTSLLTLTTSPIELTDAIEYILKPFKKIGLPSHEIAMMMTIALRFIPTLLEETDKIIKAQTARGADFDTGGIIKKAKGLLPILIPLFISAFRRADELAVAMEARCYRGDVNRVKMKVMKLTRRDARAVIIVGIATGTVIAVNMIA